MHIPDGFIDLPTSAAFAGASALAVAGAVKGARKQLSEQSAPLAGLTAVFIFAVQMLNFPVAAGTSGHLIGAALAMVLVGPYAATLALVVVLIIQARMGSTRLPNKILLLYKKITPLDILLVIDGSDSRRKFVDGIISQYDKSYLTSLLAYNKALNHRNLLLKSFWLNRNFDQESLAIWDDQLVQYGNLIYQSRKQFIADFMALII